MTQIDFADVPAIIPMPTRGLLSLFVAHDPTGELAHEAQFWNNEGYAKALFFDTTPALSPVMPPRSMRLGGSRAIAFRETISTPFREMARWPFSKGGADLSDYQALHGALGVDHLFGYPSHTSPRLRPHTRARMGPALVRLLRRRAGMAMAMGTV